VRRFGLFFAIAALAVAALMPVGASARAKRCGTKTLFGRTLAIRVVGKPVRCAKVRTIVRGRCRQRRAWSCFSLRPPDPLLVWYRSREQFRERWSTAIEARRPRCASVHVNWRRWRAERRSTGASPFPTRLQTIGDDVLRCRLLEGLKRQAIVKRLGRPDEHDARALYYGVGPERDSFFQVDDEMLAVELTRHGRFRRAEYVQS
jgi:hypothetical protein